jgi:hypothetical protein
MCRETSLRWAKFKGLIASRPRAWEGFLAGMGAQVPRHVTGLSETLTAAWPRAREGLLAGMGAQVPPHVTGLSETLIAAPPRAREGLLVGVVLLR